MRQPQLSPQHGDNLPALLRPLPTKNLLSDANADLPIRRGQRGVHRHRVVRDLE
jgi:hypothetical protein